jgi:citrate synthase
MQQRSFADTVFLLLRGRLPKPDECRLLDAILVAVADHGSGAPSCAAARLAASGNRQSFSAAIAAGILTIGDEHGGAGTDCMQLIAAGVQEASLDSITIDEAARRMVRRRRQSRSRVPGLGHRVHTTDPRVAVLFDMAREAKVASAGVSFVLALEEAARASIKPLPINIDGALAALLYDLGFPPAAGHLVFIIGRVAGLTAEVAEEYARERPMRIRIPVEYDGEPARELDGFPVPTPELQD